MRNSTLRFLIKKSDGAISEICLAMKKRGFGAGRYNGAGGKVEAGESIEDAVKRETQEEIGVAVQEFSKIAELEFMFPHKEEWNQKVHVYFCERWDGDPAESEEMNPAWFAVENIPYANMWPDDIFWLPRVLKGELIKKGKFTFGEGDAVLEQSIENVDSFT